MQKRPQGQFVIRHIADKDIDCVIAISDDRMFRNAEDSIVVNNFALKNNVKLIYTRQQHFGNMDPFSGFVMQNFSAIMNQAYSMQFSLKVKKGLLNKVKKGEWNGKSPYGYDLVNSHLQVNEEEANVVRYIFKEYSLGTIGTIIARRLNKRNIKYNNRMVGQHV